MAHRILMIDTHTQHHEVMRRFIERVHPGVELVIHDPQHAGMPGLDYDWSGYDLLLIDNNLGETNGIQWLKFSPHLDHIPPFIVVSSTRQTDTPAAMESVMHAIRMGAVSYHFKKGIQLAQFNKDVTKVLVNAPKRPELCSSSKTGLMDTKELAVQEIQTAVEDTQHEINLAMAMLEGHTEWPFTMGDILAGKAFIKHYKVASYLGNHMGGATFKVMLDGEEEPFIMYFIKRRNGDNRSLSKAQLDELAKMQEITHPNVLPIKDYHQEDEALLVIREMIESESLDHRMRQRGVYTAQAVDLFRQILMGLRELHRQGITIGQFTPKSLRVSPSDNLIYADTGLIQRLHAIHDIAGEITTPDMPMYVSPEQVQGRVIDHRSDIYSAGLIGYELIAGQPVYSKGSVKDILYSHVADPVPHLPDKNHPLNSLIREMLEKTPSKRPQSVDSLLSLLDRVVNVVA